MNDKAPFIDSVMPAAPGIDSHGRQIFPGSNINQHRPSLIKRDSDVAAPYIIDMGGPTYSYVPPKNKVHPKENR